MGANIIDPNEIISSDAFRTNDIEGMPDLSSMYIFAELTAQRRSSSILVSNGTGKANLNDADPELKINFMGVDTSTDSYTTKWTRNNENDKNEEGFGITDIHININSSYVPVVDIEFIDIRGNSLFTVGKKSKYAVLFEFPPPIFKLTVKGYYGRALQYDLHLVRQTTKFDSQTGNFIINANFVGMKYAPLTDIAFKYIDIVPLMNNNGSGSAEGINFDFSQPPKNTRELIRRSEKLYDDIEELKVTSKISEEANEYRIKYENSEQLLDRLNNFRNSINSDIQSDDISNFFIVEKQNNESDRSINILNNVNGSIRVTDLKKYSNVISKFSPNEISRNITSRLYILVDIINSPMTGNTSTDTKLNNIKASLNNLRLLLLNQAKILNSNVVDSMISEVYTTNLKTQNESTGKDISYYGIDITEYFIILNNDLKLHKTNYNIKKEEFKRESNNIAIKILGGAPTIGSIFKIICDDVDLFFNKLKKVGESSETHHAKYYNEIVESAKGTKDMISAFPTIIKRNKKYGDLNNVSDGKESTIKRNDRGYPSDVFNNISEPFPECEFVDGFINAYLKSIKDEEIFRAKEIRDINGNNRWIPITPFDSEILGNTSINSPYLGKLTPIPDMISEILNRFYVISQYSYSSQFYAKNSDVAADLLKFFGEVTTHTDLLKFIAHGEAANLVNSISNTTLLKGLVTQVSLWNEDINGFYQTLELNTKVKGPTGIEINTYKTFEIAGNPDGDLIDNTSEYGSLYILLNDGNKKISKDKKSEYFTGFDLIPKSDENSITLRTTDNSEDLIDRFIKKYSDDSIKNFIFDQYKFDGFTKQNIMYIRDKKRNEEDSNYHSDFLKNDSIKSIMSNVFINSGSILATILEDKTISEYVKTFLIVSTFKNTISYFNKDVNKKFSFPCIIEIPKFAHLYMGGLSYFFRKPTTQQIDELDTYNLKYGLKFIKIDETYDGAKNVKYISQNDTNKLHGEFLKYAEDTTDGGFGTLKNLILNVITIIETMTGITGTKLDLINEKIGVISNRINGLYYLVNYTQTAFYPDKNEFAYLSDSFTPLFNVNLNTQNKKINDTYFSLFFNEIKTIANIKETETTKNNNNNTDTINNIDIKTQLYYSMKNISDKWIMGMDGSSIYGGSSETSLFKNFKFVDRAFNDISEKVVIDFKSLIEISKDYDVSVFTVMSRLLSLNGFEFFPLQNFMNFETDEWKNCFKIFDTPKLSLSDTPKFVCMYIGGFSSQLDTDGSFDDDGVQDLNKLLDYTTGDVQGFDVYFAKQNQSIFTNIELNTNEHKETNESLSILSELSQDQSASTPVGIGQNLFSTYEQRSYTCKIELLGNVMIQPTQYFMLKNVPMFNGAYIILQVEHNITPNHMRTNLTGVRMRGIPQPFVRDFATSIGIEGGKSDMYLPESNYDNDPNINSILNANITKDQSTRLLSP